jgi:hypothetical protein
MNDSTEAPWARSVAWKPVADELQHLTHDLEAWASVVLVPISSEALKCAAHYRLPEDWAEMENRLDSGGMNALAFTTNAEVIDNDGKYAAPPSEQPLSAHRITSSAVVPIPNVGTLEVLANAEGYRFEDRQMQRMRSTAKRIAMIVGAF